MTIVEIPTPLNVSELARVHGVTRKTIRARLKRGWVPNQSADVSGVSKPKRKARTMVKSGELPMVPPMVPVAELPMVPPADLPMGNVPAEVSTLPVTPAAFVAIVLAVTSLAMAGIGIFMNAQFAASLGQTQQSAAILAAIGASVDITAVILPSIGSALWQSKHQAASVGAWLIYVGVMLLTLLASAGFAASNIGDTVANRNASISERAELVSRIDALKARHDAAIAAANAGVNSECATGEGVVCRKRRDQLAVTLADPEPELNAAISQLNRIPVYAADDPAATFIAQVTDGYIAPAVVQRVRIAGLTAAPATAGLLLSFAWLAWPRRQRNGISQLNATL